MSLCLLAPPPRLLLGNPTGDSSTCGYSLAFTHVSYCLTHHERLFIPKSELDLEVSRHWSGKPATLVVIASQTPETNQTRHRQRVEMPERLGGRQTYWLNK